VKKSCKSCVWLTRAMPPSESVPGEEAGKLAGRAADSAPGSQLVEGQFALSALPLQDICEFRWLRHDGFRMIEEISITDR
jgi:hypothetical protein